MEPGMSSVAPVERQFQAYNQHDLSAFLANFSDDFVSYRMPSPQPVLQGKAALADFYAAHRFNNPALRAELLSRTVVGNTVFDHERIYGLGAEPVTNMAVFQVEGDLITTAWFWFA
jgi:hypothetical protein